MRKTAIDHDMSMTWGWAGLGWTDHLSHDEASPSTCNQSCSPTAAVAASTLLQYGFGLTVLKLALDSHPRPKYWLSSPMWQNTLPSSKETKDSALILWADYSKTPPYSLILKIQAISKKTKFSKGDHQKLWLLEIKGIRHDISFSQFHFIPSRWGTEFNYWFIFIGVLIIRKSKHEKKLAMRQTLQPGFFLKLPRLITRQFKFSCGNASTYSDTMQKAMGHHQLSGQ